jgi:hypothetical protein|tara:strand:- start:19818 stop:21005 length:1188 start_codon:yes stop_codon:yes gene_type:complete
MSILINKHIIGSSYHAALDGELLSWSDNKETGYRYGFEGAQNSIEPLLTLFACQQPSLVPAPVINSFKECGYNSAPWSKVIPPKKFKKLFMEFISEMQTAIGIIDHSEYPSFFIETNKLFSYLGSSTVSKARCDSYLKVNDNHSLKAITGMLKGNKLPVPLYNRVSTKTGRLTIKAGPQILTLKKDFRSIFIPSIPGNKLYEIDFTSLEPRVALNIAGKQADTDVYTSFSVSSGFDIPRDVSKLATLCALYGAGTSKLESVLRTNDHKITAKRLLKEVKQYFQISSLSKSLRSQASAGTITNCFGRPIIVDDARDSILVNNFLQSSATDIALLGFLDFCETLKDIVKPIFIIHDALVFEADPEQLGPVVEYVNSGFELKEMGNFPLKISEFSSNE